MASITSMLPDHCLVLRDGVRTEIVAVDIVPGDVLYIKAGNKLPADVRFIEVSSDAKFDRAILTGMLSTQDTKTTTQLALAKSR
jgi:sodium/potassium-transporting ATPase subunit alpha